MGVGYDAGGGLLGAGIGGGLGVLLGGEAATMSGAVLGGMAEDYVRSRYDIREEAYNLAALYGTEAESFRR